MKKCQTPTSNIAFVSLMSATNAILALSTNFIPLVSLFIVLILPIISALTILYSQEKYLITYYVTSMVVSFLLNLSAPENIIFSLFPSLLSGTIIGFMVKYQKNPQIAVVVTSISHAIFTLATVPLIKSIYQVDMFEVFFKLLKINSLETAKLTFLPLIYVLSLIQSIFTVFIFKNELKKFNITYSLDIQSTHISSLLSIFSFLLSIISIFLYKPLVYLFLAISISLGVFSLIKIFFKSPKLGIITSAISLFLFIILFAALYNALSKQFLPMLFIIFIIPSTIIDVVSSIIKKYITTLKKVG